MAVLFRTNAQSSRFEAAFTRRGVPFRIGEGQRFAARAAGARPARPAARGGAHAPGSAVRAPPRRSRGRRSERDDRDDGVGHATRPTRHAPRSDAVLDRDALLELGRDYLEAVERHRWRRRVHDLARHGHGRRVRRGAHGVDLVTFHRAKGLEWTVVFVTGLERGLVPISWATTGRSPGRGTPAPARRAQSGRGRAALSRGRGRGSSAPGGRRGNRRPGSGCSRTRRTTHRTAC